MHIGFDISQTGAGRAGCGHFAHAMIQALLELAPQHRYALYPGFGDGYFDPQMPLLNPYPGREVHYGPRHLSRAAAGAFWHDPLLENRLERPDIVHANNFWCPLQLQHGRLIYTFYDAGFLIEPGWTTEANRLLCFDGLFRSAQAADWIVAISDASRSHYLRLFPHFPPERVRVIHPCSRFADPDRPGVRPAALSGVASGGFWLSVGTIEPRKNQLMLAEAYARHRAQGGPRWPLVFAGGNGWLMEDFQQRLQALGVADAVLMTGYVSDDELIWLYRHCLANLYPSFFEGFGLPVLEGMQFGAATLCSNTSSLPEVGAEAALLLAPDDVEAWATAMHQVGTQAALRARMQQAGRARAALFDRNRAAGQLLQLYRQALASPRRAVPGP